jgi:starch phosphorylase
MPVPPLNDIVELQAAIERHLRYTLVRLPNAVRKRDLFPAVALAIRDRIVDQMAETEARYDRHDAKRLYYLSMEFLMGRALGNNLVNMNLLETCREALWSIGVDLEEIRDQERDAALGNGGLGRLAACYLDSLATLGMPGYGYGIHYEYGLFHQAIRAGRQHELPDVWHAHDSPWLIERPEQSCVVPVYGRIEHGVDRRGAYHPKWVAWKLIVGVPYDMPIVGYGGHTVNVLRLYSARASDEFDIHIFNQGDYIRAVEEKIRTETISKVLYPSDSCEEGKELRLLQEYFFVACAVRDMVRRYLRRHDTFDSFPDQVAVQLNDTHPALAVAELMRMLVDEHGLGWDRAWEITTATLAYTNHTLLPEALENWSVELLERLLPRHLQIIYEINHRFLETVRQRWGDDGQCLRRMSIIEENGRRQVRMANLAIVGSHAVNGVSALHSELVKTSLVPDFYALWPERFHNKTNGVTQRRWLLKANPELAALATEVVGDGWVTDLGQLRGIEASAEDPAFQERFRRIKRANKERLAKVIRDATSVEVDPDSLYDVQAKRIHEYKRQLLMAMGVAHAYLTMVEDGREPQVSRTYVFAGKAAPGYWAAKEIIHLIHDIARTVNRDARVRGRLRVAFVPDYRVSLAERIIPAADLSEQISTAGREASGTGNMKFALNGALTVGTLDGANIEIGEEVGWENIFIFGLRAEQIAEMRANDSYDPLELYERDQTVQRIVDALASGRFSPLEPARYTWLVDALLGRDEYFHLADLAAYVDVQARVSAEYVDAHRWTAKAIRNVARIGKFSSDRAVREYARDIWGLRSYAAADEEKGQPGFAADEGGAAPA